MLTIVIWIDKNKEVLWSTAITVFWFNIGRFWGDDMAAFFEGLLP